jgi:phytanoyl-CoA dioxygenase PhyH
LGIARPQSHGQELRIASATRQESPRLALDRHGFAAPVEWADPDVCARAGERLIAAASAARDVLRDPHLNDPRLREELVVAPARRVLRPLLGDDLAIENVFALIKRPSYRFEVPLHQDGINANLELDPTRSLAVWVAITDATPTNGCLEIVPGSHAEGYRAFVTSAHERQAEGRPVAARGVSASEELRRLPLRRGQACLLDSRTLHRSRSNRGDSPRVGLNIRFVAPGGIRRAGDSRRTVFSISAGAEVRASCYGTGAAPRGGEHG